MNNKNFLRLKDLNEITREWILEKENYSLHHYLASGYFNTADELSDLHRSYSPYKVPSNLTKLQIKRRINKFRKGGCVLKNPYENVRVEILVNKKCIAGFTYENQIKNDKDLINFLQGLVKMLKSPTIDIGGKI